MHTTSDFNATNAAPCVMFCYVRLAFLHVPRGAESTNACTQLAGGEIISARSNEPDLEISGISPIGELPGERGKYISLARKL